MRGREAEREHEGAIWFLCQVRSKERGRLFPELPGAVLPKLPSLGFSLKGTILDVEGPVASHAAEEHRSAALESALEPGAAAVPLADVVRAPTLLAQFGGPEGEVIAFLGGVPIGFIPVAAAGEHPRSAGKTDRRRSGSLAVGTTETDAASRQSVDGRRLDSCPVGAPQEIRPEVVGEDEDHASHWWLVLGITSDHGGRGQSNGKNSAEHREKTSHRHPQTIWFSVWSRVPFQGMIPGSHGESEVSALFRPPPIDFLPATRGTSHALQA